MDVIRCEDLTKLYASTVAVDGLSLTVTGGQVLLFGAERVGQDNDDADAARLNRTDGWAGVAERPAAPGSGWVVAGGAR